MMLKNQFASSSVSLFPKRVIAIATSLVCTGMLAPIPVDAATPNIPRLLAQQVNGRIATLQCGGYTITIRFAGYASGDTYSYETRGLFLRDGTRDGDDYVFHNSDYEYRVTTTGGGAGRLQVFHYGERILDKRCTWS